MSNRDFSLSLAEALIRSQLKANQTPSSGSGQQAPSPPPLTLTISREVGALGNSVATEVGRRLDWPVYDREILDLIGEELHRHPARLEGVDERPASWLGERLSCLFDKYQVGSDVYLKHLFAVVRGLGAAGRCVIVGRGANFLLPAETTLRVRLVALPEDRARVLAARLGASGGEAGARLKVIERERAEFVKRTFREDPADPHHYDLVLNMSSLSVDEAADVIIETLRRRERGGPKGGQKRPALGQTSAGVGRPASAALA